MPEQLRDRVRWDLDKGVARVTMARPEAGNALDLALTNRLLTGREAAEWGLVSRAVPAEELTTVAEQVVEGLRTGPSSAFAETKRLVATARSRTLAEQLDEESAAIARLITGPDGREGVDAFLAKRPAAFERSTA